MKTPDVTPAQIGALIVFAGGELVSWGLLSGHTEQILVASASTAVAIGWKIADAIIRNGRAHAGASKTLEDVVSVLVASTDAKPTAAG